MQSRSDCKISAENGGHLGQVMRGQTVAEFEATLRCMQPGEFAIAETRYGLHVVWLDHMRSNRSCRSTSHATHRRLLSTRVHH
jgi:peptidyl-prolyl cis-trans isomerase C